MDGVAAFEKRETVITFLAKERGAGSKIGPEFGPFLVPLSVGTFPEGSENGRIFLGPHTSIRFKQSS